MVVCHPYDVRGTREHPGDRRVISRVYRLRSSAAGGCFAVRLDGARSGIPPLVVSATGVTLDAMTKLSPSKKKREHDMPAAMKDDETARDRASVRRSDDVKRGKPMRGGHPAKPRRGEKD